MRGGRATSSSGARPGRDTLILVSPWDTFPLGTCAFSVAPHMADAFLDDDAPVVMATPGPTGLAPIPAVSRGAVVGPARESLSV